MKLDDITEFSSSPLITKKLIDFGAIRSFGEGEIILAENALLNSVPIIVTGSIRVMRESADGREILLYYIKEGEICIMSLLAGRRHETSKVKIIAQEKTEALLIPIDKLSILAGEFPEWRDYIFRSYHDRFQELLELISDIAFQKLDERLLTFLKKKCELTNSTTLYITHERLANKLGTSRVVVSRILKQMEEKGQLKLGRNKVSLV